MSTIVTGVTDPRSGGLIAVNVEIGLAYPLTLCCNASGKGGGEGVICRSCYEDVDLAFGDGWPVDALPDSFRAAVLREISLAPRTLETARKSS